MDKHPTELTDEQLDAAIAGEEVVEQEAPVEPTESEEVTEVEEQPEPEEPETPQEEPQPEEEPEPVSRRASLRIAKLVEQQLQQRQPEPQTAPKQENVMDYSQHLEADPEVVKQLETDRQKYGQAQFNAGLEQAKSIQFHTRLEIDAPRVESKYSQLNPEDKQNFNPVLADTINNMYLATVGYNPQTQYVANPNVRYAEYVDGIMELADEIAGQKTAVSTKNIAKQVATTGLRPDGSQAKRINLNKLPHEMTDEELDLATQQEAELLRKRR